MTPGGGSPFASVDALQHALAGEQYIAERALAVPIYLALRLERPLFLEGEAGVGKTEVAKALAAALQTSLIRLQCYEGLDVSLRLLEHRWRDRIEVHHRRQRPKDHRLFLLTSL